MVLVWDFIIFRIEHGENKYLKSSAVSSFEESRAFISTPSFNSIANLYVY